MLRDRCRHIEQRVRRSLLAFYIVVALVTPGSAVDRAKFRKCSQGSFCKRYKKYVKKIEDGGLVLHSVDPAGMRLEGNVLHAQLEYVANVTEEIRPLNLQLAFYRDSVLNQCGIVRITLTEEEPLYPRFQLQDGDVVVGALPPDKVVLTHSESGSTSEIVSEGNCAVTIRHKPFEVNISSDGRVLQRLNDRHLLNFEQYRARDAPTPRSAVIDATDVFAEGLREEFFDGHTDSKPRGPAAVGIDVTFADAQVLTGLAEHATRLHLGSQKFDGNEPYRLYNLDVFEYEVDTPMALYGVVPLVTAVHRWSQTGVLEAAVSGFMILNPSEGFVKVASPPAESLEGEAKTWWLFESGVLDIFSFAGPTPQRMMEQYHSVTGWPRLPLFATLGKHQSRWNYINTDDVLEVDAGFDKHRIPYDVIWLDLEHTDGKKYFTWHPKHFAEADKMLTVLESKNRALVTIVDPHIKKEPNYTIWESLNRLETFTRKADNTTFEGFCWPGDSNYPDFCNPAARDAWADLFAPSTYPNSRHNLLTWNDMNEPSVFNGPEVTMPRDNLHKCTENDYTVEHRDMHNLYGLYHHNASVQGQLKRTPSQRPFVLTRSFFAGTHRVGPVWTGDNMAHWSHLERSVPMLVSLALCGISFAGADVGGFNGDPDTELLVRWHQLGIWYPFYRAHAHLTTKRREPWLFGKDVTANIRNSVLVRYQMLPMWYTLAADWAFRGLPMLRPLWYHNLTDLASYSHVDDHFFVGEAIVVRSVPAGRKTVEVYLPPGDWFDFWSEKKEDAQQGGQTISVTVHPSHVPVFVRSGSILTAKLRPRRSALSMEGDPYTIYVYGSSARGRIYIDDGRSHDFQSGAFIYDELVFDGSSLRSHPVDTQLPALGSSVARVDDRRAPSSPLAAGLRVERVVFFGLASPPKSAEVAGEIFQVSAEPLAGNAAWVATVRNPSVQLGPPNAWSINLHF